MLGRVRSAMAQLVGGLGGGGSPSGPQSASASSSSAAAAPSPTPPAAPGPSSSPLSANTTVAPASSSSSPSSSSCSSTTVAGTSSCKREPPPPPPQSRRGSFSRPAFLQLTAEELLQADDHTGRAVQSPRESRRRLPWSTGYAEVINAGKSQHNEDQACCEAVFVERRRGLRANPASKEASGDPEEGSKGLCFYYWGLFDGHAGSGAAIMASKLLHFHIRDQLRDLVDILQVPSPPPICLQDGSRTLVAESNKAPLAEDDAEVPNNAVPRFHMEKVVSHESLVVGAIENAYKQMSSWSDRHGMKCELERTPRPECVPILPGCLPSGMCIHFLL